MFGRKKIVGFVSTVDSFTFDQIIKMCFCTNLDSSKSSNCWSNFFHSFMVSLLLYSRYYPLLACPPFASIPITQWGRQTCHVPPSRWQVTSAQMNSTLLLTFHANPLFPHPLDNKFLLFSRNLKSVAVKFKNSGWWIFLFYSFKMAKILALLYNVQFEDFEEKLVL